MTGHVINGLNEYQKKKNEKNKWMKELNTLI